MNEPPVAIFPGLQDAVAENRDAGYALGEVSAHD